MEVIAHRRWPDCVFGLTSNAVLLRQAAARMQAARRLHQYRGGLAQVRRYAPPPSSRLYEEFYSAAQSWAQPWRVVLKAEVMSAGDNPRLVVTSVAAPTPQMRYEDRSCARGTCENALKAVQVDLRSDRTAATPFLANAMRRLLACAASVLHHAGRTHTVQHTGLAQAQPSTIMLTLCKIAAQVKQYKDRICLHLPSACPVKALLQRVPTLRYAVPVPVGNTS
jgi:hypothetical protein